MGNGGKKVARHVKLSKSNRDKNPFAKKVSQNKAFKKRHGIKYLGATDAMPDSLKLADLDIPPYEHIVNMSEENARRFLIQHGVLSHNRHRLALRCWGCQAEMVKQVKGWRCPSGRQCKVRARIENADLIWTPFATYNKGPGLGNKPSYKGFLRSAYTLGLKMSANQAAHVTRTENITHKAQMKRLEHYNRWHRIVLAFSEYKHAQEHRFPTEVIECDAARFGTTRCSDGARMHRPYFGFGRSSKQAMDLPALAAED